MQKNLIALALAILLAGVWSSCKKTGANGSSCEITGIAFVGQDTTQKVSYKIYYDNQGRVDSIRENEANGSTILKTFDRAGNSVVMHTFTATYQSTDSIVINGAGLAVRDLQTSTLGSKTLYEYIYSGSELQETIMPAPAGDTTFFQWQNGDMTSEPRVPITYGYNDKPSMPGDYWHLTSLINSGAPGIVTAHQVDSIYLPAGAQTINIAYTYDNDGKITELTSSGGLSQTVTYQYRCH